MKTNEEKRMETIRNRAKKNSLAIRNKLRAKKQTKNHGILIFC